MDRFSRFNISFFYRCTILSLAISLLFFYPILAQSAESVYEQQIQQARNGNYVSFLDYLQRYQQQYSLTPDQVADWMQVASWAGRNDEVIRIWQRYRVYMALPARGIAAAAQACRNLKRWQTSLELWEQARDLAPDNDDYRIGHIKTLADARRDEQALREASQLVAEQRSVPHLQALSYVYLRQGKNWDRLSIDLRTLDIAPDNPEALADLIATLTMNRINAPALALLTRASLSPAQRRNLQLNAAAELVRLADTSSRGEKARFTLAQTALNRYNDLLSRWRNDPQADSDIIRARIDRLGALYVHGDYGQLIDEYEALTSEQQAIPSWAMSWVISAWLAEKKVGSALAIMQQHPEYFAALQENGHELFFVLQDSGQYQATHQYVERVIQTSPYTRRVFGSSAAEPNDQWLAGQSLNFQYLLMINALPEAEKLAHRLATTAPGNQGLRIDYAGLLLARGLPRAAERELKTAEVREPSNIALERQQAYVAMALQEWRQMALLIDDVAERAPRDLATQRLLRTREVHHMSELRINASQGIHSDNPISGTHDFSWDSAIYGPPLADNWRLFAGNRFTKGNFAEGKGSSRNLAGGVEWRPRDHWAELELSSNHFHGASKPGARLSVGHNLNDRWLVGGELERLSRSTPLRALRNGISANRGEGWIRWYQNERREYRFSAAASRFSDQNHRQEYVFYGKERLWQTPLLSVDLEPGLSASLNTRSETIYYSPKRDFSASAALSASHMMYQHYDTAWSQQLTAGGGIYWQKKYDPGAIALLRYGQRVRWNNVLDTGVTLSWDKRPYDGKRESNLSLSFDVNLRF